MTDMRYANIFYKWKDFHMNEMAAARWMKACKRKRVGGPCKCKWIQGGGGGGPGSPPNPPDWRE